MSRLLINHDASEEGLLNVRMPFELLVELLQLPSGTQIVDVVALGDSECAFDVRGEGFPADAWGTALARMENDDFSVKILSQDNPRRLVLVDLCQRSMVLLNVLYWPEEARPTKRHEVPFDLPAEPRLQKPWILARIAVEWGAGAEAFEVRGSGEAVDLAHAMAIEIRRLRPAVPVDVTTETRD